ncbi:MAG TPA: hypothetical protein PKE26_04520 [Kiritimatiellia bacterium]|nr:hypothetical protein [Kiritimatiellia bacterium]HMO98354.1 hypothetical protein [Kiritimatiellia bacterium]
MKINWLRGLVVFLAWLGGAVALAHQVVWTRRMVDLLGASAGSAARVFGCFFLGLALGALAGAWLVGRIRRPWRWLGGAELLIALFCLPMLLLPWWADPIWPWLGPEGLMGWSGGWMKWTLSVGLVLPPAFLMGLFLPLAVMGWPRRRDEAPVDPGLWLYAVNTLGAVAGVALVAAWALPGLGMTRVMTGAILLNGMAAIGCLALDTWGQRTEAPSEPEPDELRGYPGRQVLLISGLSGGLIMATEVVALLVIHLVAPLSLFAPGAVLGVFIGALAISAVAMAWVNRDHVISEAVLRWIPATAGLMIAWTPLMFLWLAPRFPLAVEQSSLIAFFLRLSFFTGLVFGPALLVAGLWFPALAAWSGESKRGGRRRWGWILAVNGVGGWLGAELAYGVILPVMGPFAGLGLIGVMYAVAAWALIPARASFSLRGMVGGSLVITAVLTLWILPGLPTVNPRFAPYVIAQSHGREGSLAVVDDPVMGRALLLQNQYVLGSVAGTAAQERQAHLPLLLHPEPSRVGLLGLATGITAGGALVHQAVRSVEAVEISRTVTDAAATWFTDANRNVAQHPRATIHIEDGRTWLAAHRETFDVLISDLFLPWGPGEGRLYTVEHFSAARRSLREGGLFCLWLPMYQLTDPHFMVILNTFMEVFPVVELFRRDDDAAAPALGLVGWRGGIWQEEVSARRQREETGRADDALLQGRGALRDYFVGRIERGRINAPVNRLGNLWIEREASRMRVLQPETAPYLSGHRWSTWLRALQLALDSPPEVSR